MKFYSYIDGLKTGYTDNAGYCLTATGKKKNMRLISVVMGEESTDKRSSDTLAMLDYGFSMYSIDKIISKEDTIGEVSVNLGNKEKVQLKIVDEVNILNNNQDNKRNITYEINTKSINAPIKSGDIVGEVIIYEDGKYLMKRNLTVCCDVEKANILKIFLRNMRDILGFNF